jgi:hypothetical protein
MLSNTIRHLHHRPRILTGRGTKMIGKTICFILIGILSVSLPSTAETAADPIQGYQAELGLYVSKGLVDYKAWSKDRRGLDRFIASLNQADLKALPDSEKKALLINAYNACMIWMILKHYPIEGVFDIKPNAFKQRVFQLGGETVSLDDIEHEKLRKMGDPRIHFAIVCASIGCPDLMPAAYDAESLDDQLDEASRLYFSQKKGLRVSTDPLRVKLSRLFDWFGEDFGRDKAEKLRFVSRYAPEKWRNLLKNKAKKISLKYIAYDWALNGR